MVDSLSLGPDTRTIPEGGCSLSINLYVRLLLVHSRFLWVPVCSWLATSCMNPLAPSAPWVQLLKSTTRKKGEEMRKRFFLRPLQRKRVKHGSTKDHFIPTCEVLHITDNPVSLTYLSWLCSTHIGCIFQKGCSRGAFLD